MIQRLLLIERASCNEPHAQGFTVREPEGTASDRCPGAKGCPRNPGLSEKHSAQYRGSDGAQTSRGCSYRPAITPHRSHEASFSCLVPKLARCSHKAAVDGTVLYCPAKATARVMQAAVDGTVFSFNSKSSNRRATGERSSLPRDCRTVCRDISPFRIAVRPHDAPPSCAASHTSSTHSTHLLTLALSTQHPPRSTCSLVSFYCARDTTRNCPRSTR